MEKGRVKELRVQEKYGENPEFDCGTRGGKVARNFETRGEGKDKERRAQKKLGGKKRKVIDVKGGCHSEGAIM